MIFKGSENLPQVLYTCIQSYTHTDKYMSVYLYPLNWDLKNLIKLQFNYAHAVIAQRSTTEKERNPILRRMNASDNLFAANIDKDAVKHT